MCSDGIIKYNRTEVGVFSLKMQVSGSAFAYNKKNNMGVRHVADAARGDCEPYSRVLLIKITLIYQSAIANDPLCDGRPGLI